VTIEMPLEVQMMMMMMMMMMMKECRRDYQ
jgi:hypothetical protein